MEDEKKVIPEKIVPDQVMANRELFTAQNPHPSGAYWDSIKMKWSGYKPTKGYAPPWRPFDHNKDRKRGPTINEKKFLMVLSITGSLNDAFRAAYKTPVHEDKRIVQARIASSARIVLERIKKKAPDLVAAYTFDDVNKDFIKKEMLRLYSSDHATIAEKTRLLELMGKTQAMFTDKVISDTKIREVVDNVYTESSEDFPDQKDDRISRIEVENINLA